MTGSIEVLYIYDGSFHTGWSAVVITLPCAGMVTSTFESAYKYRRFSNLELRLRSVNTSFLSMLSLGVYCGYLTPEGIVVLFAIRMHMPWVLLYRGNRVIVSTRWDSEGLAFGCPDGPIVKGEHVTVCEQAFIVPIVMPTDWKGWIKSLRSVPLCFYDLLWSTPKSRTVWAYLYTLSFLCTYSYLPNRAWYPWR